MKYAQRGGFTLIELLTVIAIIAILASMVFVVGPRAIERARIASLMNVFNQLRTACTSYITTHRTYPPAYGYRVWKAPDTGPDLARFFLTPYMDRVKFFRNFDMYDPFAQDSSDTNGDQQISLLEFSPVGRKSGPDRYDFPTELYRGNNLPQEVAEQLTTQRPLVYIPVNLEQARKVQQYYYLIAQTNGQEQAGWYARRWDPTETFQSKKNPIADMKFPPPKYDEFVLISVGPTIGTGGILTPPPDFLARVVPDDWYHVLALRAYFLATRDMNDNGQLDFDYRSRTRFGEGKPDSYPLPNMNLLPDGTNGAGPMIYLPHGSSGA